MSEAESQLAATKPRLRWYQFSLRTLFGFMLWVAICCSIIATGMSRHEYQADLHVVLPYLRCIIRTEDYDLWECDVSETQVEMCCEVIHSPIVAEHAAQRLREERVVSIDGEPTSPESLMKRIRIGDRGRRASLLRITACSSDPDQSLRLVVAFYEAWLAAIPQVVPSLEDRYLELVRAELSPAGWQRFEAQYRGDIYWRLSDPELPGRFSMAWEPIVTIVHPYRTAAIWAAIAWAALGAIAITFPRLGWIAGMSVRGWFAGQHQHSCRDDTPTGIAQPNN